MSAEQGGGRGRHEGPKAKREAPTRILARAAGRGLQRVGRRIPPGVRTRIAPILCVLCAVLIGVAEFLDVIKYFNLVEGIIDRQSGADRHGYALLVLGVLSVTMMLMATATGARAPAIAVGICGLAAVAIVVFIDAVDLGEIGLLRPGGTPVVQGARADPAAGFWIEAAGAVGLLISGLLLATATPERLRESYPGRRFSRRTPESDETAAPAEA